MVEMKIIDVCKSIEYGTFGVIWLVQIAFFFQNVASVKTIIFWYDTLNREYAGIVILYDIVWNILCPNVTSFC